MCPAESAGVRPAERGALSMKSQLSARAPWRGPSSPLVAEYLVQWLAGRQVLRPSTRLAYEIHLRRYLIPRLGQIRLRDLTLVDVEAAYRGIRADAGLEPATVRRIHATLTSALNAAVRRGLLGSNPAQDVELPRTVTPRMQVWTAPQLALFLDFVSQERLAALFTLLAVLGLRRGEAIGLRWTDVDQTRRVLLVEQQIVAVAGLSHVGPPKSARGRRTVALPSRVSRALTAHAHRQTGERAGAGPGWVDTGLVFTTACGEALIPGSVSRCFDRLVAQAALPAIRLHDLRHTSASLGLDAGESLLEVSRRLGHSSIAITADVYSHVPSATAHRSAQRLDDLITQALPALPRGAQS